MIANADWQDYTALQDLAIVVLGVAGVAVLVWAAVRTLGGRAERLDREGFWDRRVAKRRKRHHGPISLPERKTGQSGLR